MTTGKTVEAVVDAAGPDVRVQFLIGDGVIGTWAADARGGELRERRWVGRSNDRFPDEVRLKATPLQDGQVVLHWVISLLGPTLDAPYHVRVKVEQRSRSVLDEPVRFSGTVAAGSVTELAGAVAFRAK